jgi:hypothetical protein
MARDTAQVARPKPNAAQKALRRQKQLDLAADLDASRNCVNEDVQEIAQKHGW